jgi:ribosomal protein S8E
MTPPMSGGSESYRADRRRDPPSPINNLDRPAMIEPVGKMRKRVAERRMMGGNLRVRMLVGHGVSSYPLSIAFEH